MGADGKPTAFLSQGYPLFLSAAFAIGGPSIATVKAANVVIASVSIALIYLSARQFFKSRSIAAISAILFATYTVSIVYTTYVAKENIMIFLIARQIFIVTRPIRYARTGDFYAVLFGIATASLAVSGNAAISMLPALLVQLIFVLRSPWRFTRYAAIAAVTAALVVSPILYRNHKNFGAYVLNNTGGFNLYIGNNPNATPYFESIAATPIGPQWHALHDRLGEHGADRLLFGLALQHIVSHPIATIRLSLGKAVAFWTPPFHYGKYVEGTAAKIARYIWMVEFCVICGLFLLTLARFRTYPQSLTVNLASGTRIHGSPHDFLCDLSIQAARHADHVHGRGSRGAHGAILALRVGGPTLSRAARRVARRAPVRAPPPPAAGTAPDPADRASASRRRAPGSARPRRSAGSAAPRARSAGHRAATPVR